MDAGASMEVGGYIAGGGPGGTAAIIAGHAADAVALWDGGSPTTYGELRHAVASLRAALAEAGVASGDAVVIACANSSAFVTAYLAALGLGAVAVPLNPMSPTPEIARELAVVAPTAAIIDPVSAGAWAGRGAATPSRCAVFAAGGASLLGAISLEEAVANGDAEAVPPVMVTDDAPAAYIFTSGTAGAPKAAVLTHGNLLANIAQVRAVASVGESDVVYGVLPFFHIFGLNVVLGVSLAAGASVVIAARFDPRAALDTFAARSVSVVAGAPAMWGVFAALDDAGPAFASVRLALSGAAKLPESVARTMAERHGVQVHEGYGLTEAAPVVTTSVPIRWRPGVVGVPLPGVEVRVVDDDGDDALVGDTGEVWVRGANVFAGYLGDREATARVLDADGWLHTGDVGVVDDEGLLALVDRAKDLIIVSGFNVYPAEVEDAISAHPGVAECAVVGAAHSETGETVHAWVVPAPGATLDQETVVEHSRGLLARYKCPTKVTIVDALPRNLTGKILRRELD